MSTETAAAVVAATTAASSINLEKCSVVLLDFAGTTSSIGFVKDVLFKYVTDNAEAYLKDNFGDDKVKEAVKQLKDGDLDAAAATELLKEQTNSNSDNQGAKALQKLIYEKGYGDASISTHVFDDVSACLESWAKSCKIAIYSTGTCDAQKLLLSKTVAGDLTAHIAKYYDQSVVGVKTDKESYAKIAKDMEVACEEIVFVSDKVEEVKAALEAGLKAAVIEREGNAAISDEDKKDLVVIKSFAELPLDSASGKRKIEEAEAEAPPAKVAKTEETKPAVEEEKKASEDAIMEVDDAKAAAPTQDKSDNEQTKTEETTEKTEQMDTATTEEQPKKEETKETKSEATADAKSDDKPEEKMATDAAEVKPAEEAKTEEVAAATKAEEVTDNGTTESAEETKKEETPKEAKEEKAAETKEEKVTETKEETKPEAAEESKAEAKAEKTEEEKTEADAKVVTNGTSEAEEQKENKSELANGVAKEEAKNGDATAAVAKEEKNGVVEPETTEEEAAEIKVKKLEDATAAVETTPVAVEV